MGNAFVLMRVFNPVVAELDKIDTILNSDSSNIDGTGILEIRFLEKFERAIISVKINNSILIICDDTPKTDKEKWARHDRNIKRILKRHGFSKEDNNLYFTDADQGGNGSSLAQWRLRKYFLHLTENTRNAFAILLDQDDVLVKNAVKSISKRIGHDHIVISRFKVTGETERDIMKDSGAGHGSMVKMGRYIGCILSRCPQKLSTIGWTKAYSRSAMDIMVKDFESYFKEKKLDICDFFKEHRAYEDFMDFYILLREGITLRAGTLTHMYHKHADSITSRPDLKAFSHDRADMLTTLADICSANRRMLTKGWERRLKEFLKIKIDEIEGILRLNREKAAAGNVMLKQFTDSTYDGWFAESICSKTENRYVYDAVKDWMKSLHERKTIESIASATGKCQSKQDKQRNRKETQTPKQVQLHKSKRHFIGVSVLYFVAILFLALCFLEYEYKDCKLSIKYNDRGFEIISIFLSIGAAFGSYIWERVRQLEIQADEEASIKKLYNSEFEDLIRHLEANLKIVIEIRRKLETGDKTGIPMEIHFENLKWPEKSTIFQEKVATIIDKSKVDDFSRLRLNVRNMNNSAEWLKNYCSCCNYSIEKMKEMIDWEIWRMIAYYVNFSYMKEHNFEFPPTKQLDLYISYPETKERLYSLFLSVDDKGKKAEIAAKYIRMYYTDRRIQRQVLFR